MAKVAKKQQINGALVEEFQLTVLDPELTILNKEITPFIESILSEIPNFAVYLNGLSAEEQETVVNIDNYELELAKRDKAIDDIIEKQNYLKENFEKLTHIDTRLILKTQLEINNYATKIQQLEAQVQSVALKATSDLEDVRTATQAAEAAASLKLQEAKQAVLDIKAASKASTEALQAAQQSELLAMKDAYNATMTAEKARALEEKAAAVKSVQDAASAAASASSSAAAGERERLIQLHEQVMATLTAEKAEALASISSLESEASKNVAKITALTAKIARPLQKNNTAKRSKLDTNPIKSLLEEDDDEDGALEEGQKPGGREDREEGQKPGGGANQRTHTKKYKTKRRNKKTRK